MPTVESQGTLFQIEGDPGVWHTVARRTSIDGPDGQAPIDDTSDLDFVAREKRIGLPDEGRFTLSLFLDPTDTNGQVRMRNARINRTQESFRMVLPDAGSTTLAWAGYVLSWPLQVAVDQVIRVQTVVEVTGAVTYS